MWQDSRCDPRGIPGWEAVNALAAYLVSLNRTITALSNSEIAEILRLYSCLDPIDKSPTKYSLKSKKNTLSGPWRASQKRSGSVPGQQAAERYLPLIYSIFVIFVYGCVYMCIYIHTTFTCMCLQYTHIMWIMPSRHLFVDCSWFMARLPTVLILTGFLSVSHSDSTKSSRKPEIGLGQRRENICNTSVNCHDLRSYQTVNRGLQRHTGQHQPFTSDHKQHHSVLLVSSYLQLHTLTSIWKLKEDKFHTNNDWKKMCSSDFYFL